MGLAAIATLPGNGYRRWSVRPAMQGVAWSRSQCRSCAQAMAPA